jgi:hypothetical protein
MKRLYTSPSLPIQQASGFTSLYPINTASGAMLRANASFAQTIPFSFSLRLIQHPVKDI